MDSKWENFFRSPTPIIADSEMVQLLTGQKTTLNRQFILPKNNFVPTPSGNKNPSNNNQPNNSQPNNNPQTQGVKVAVMPFNNAIIHGQSNEATANLNLMSSFPDSTFTTNQNGVINIKLSGNQALEGTTLPSMILTFTNSGNVLFSKTYSSVMSNVQGQAVYNVNDTIRSYKTLNSQQIPDSVSLYTDMDTIELRMLH